MISIESLPSPVCASTTPNKIMGDVIMGDIRAERALKGEGSACRKGDTQRIMGDVREGKGSALFRPSQYVPLMPKGKCPLVFLTSEFFS